MAQSSFDIVSEVDLQEVRNAVDQASREIHQRFDFKNTDTSLTLDDEKIELHSATEDRLKAALPGPPGKGGQARGAPQGPPARRRRAGREGFGPPDDLARDRASPTRRRRRSPSTSGRPCPKIQTQIQGAQVRVSSKSRDDLQAAIRAVKEHDFGIALQFTNYR